MILISNYVLFFYRDEQLMRAYCEEAQEFGEKLYYLGDKERHVTVIVNPAANEGYLFLSC